MLYCTRKGADALSIKWQELEKELRETQGKKADVVATGGICDNFSYDELMREEELINGKMRDLRKILCQAVVIDDQSCIDPTRLRIGHVADITINGEPKSFRIGGYGDHDAEAKPEVISYLAPIIKNLIGKEKGSEVIVPLTSGTKNVVLIDIRMPESK